MDYKEALNFIHKTNKFGMVLGLESISELLNRLGNPQKKLKFIHIAGTNGKGSVASYISSVLVESGYKTGLFTSPYLEAFNERIRLNGENISDEDLAISTSEVKEKILEMVNCGLPHPTEFEIVTAIAFDYYRRVGADIVVLEVGLGGRFDATNVIDESLLSIITSISLDHVDILGNSISEIAHEKAGIIKNKGRVFVYDQSKDAIDEIEKICKEKNASCIVSNFKDIEISKSNLNNQVFSIIDYRGERHSDIKIRLLGEHQVKNATLAFNALLYLKNEGILENLSMDRIYSGLLKTKWKGRFEVVSESPLHIIDGAHNSESAIALSTEIERLIGDEYDKTLIIGVLKDKDVDSIIKSLVPLFDRVVITLPDNPRAMPVEELSYRVGMYADDIICIEDIQEAVDYAEKTVEKIKIDSKNKLKINKNNNKKLSNKNRFDRKETTKNKFAIISAGSLYLIGNIRNILLNKNAE